MKSSLFGKLSRSTIRFVSLGVLLALIAAGTLAGRAGPVLAQAASSPPTPAAGNCPPGFANTFTVPTSGPVCVPVGNCASGTTCTCTVTTNGQACASPVISGQLGFGGKLTVHGAGFSSAGNVSVQVSPAPDSVQPPMAPQEVRAVGGTSTAATPGTFGLTLTIPCSLAEAGVTVVATDETNHLVSNALSLMHLCLDSAPTSAGATSQLNSGQLNVGLLGTPTPSPDLTRTLGVPSSKTSAAARATSSTSAETVLTLPAGLLLPTKTATTPVVPTPSDLAVRPESPDASGNAQFTVANLGGATAGAFRIAVAAGAQSFSVSVDSMSPGNPVTYSIPGLHCGQAVLVIVDADSQVKDSDRENNIYSFNASCPIDSGSRGVPASN